MVYDLQRTTLIQRLKKPQGTIGHFGAGYRNGGLSEEAAEALKGVLTFDYMGRSEFEYGQVAQSIDEIARYFIVGNAHQGELTIMKRPVLYICRKNLREGVERRIRDLARGKGEEYLIEPSLFKEGLGRGPDERDIVGWLELNNDFMFFIDRRMYNGMLDFFRDVRINSPMADI